MPYIVSLFMIFAAVLSIASCSTSEVDTEQQVERSADVLYNEAAMAMDAANFGEAAQLFNEVERQHPYSSWATKAQLMAAYGYYKDLNYDQAILSLDRFIKLNPGHKDIDYAFYLKALAYYEQISDVGRDQAMTQMAMENLEILIRRFPNSRYVRDDSLKRDLTRDHLAGKEMEIGRYYLTRGQYNASINRFKSVVREYETTTHTAEALYRMVEAYMALGIRPEATRIAAVLGYNYPGSVWYKDAYKLLNDRERERLLNEQSFVDRTINSIFSRDDEPSTDLDADIEAEELQSNPVQDILNSTEELSASE